METLLLLASVLVFGVSAVQFFRTRGRFWLILALAAIATVIYLFVVTVTSPAAPIVAAESSPVLGSVFFGALIVLSALVIIAGIFYMFYSAFSSARKSQTQAS